MHPPVGMSMFEFVILSSLRAAQLTRGCTPRVESSHKIITTAQMEVAERKVVAAAAGSVVALEIA
jgi:DNA-directed RNA polymerase subunit K/omega